VTSRVAVIACGALAREIRAVLVLNGLDHVTLKCLPAKLHNHPARIPGAVADAIDALRSDHDEIVVAYGDCGTGGQLDTVLKARGVARIAGPHCYSFFTGNQLFEERADTDMRSFFLTDFLVRQFETLVIRPLWLDTHPELLPSYFGAYVNLVYLAQTDDENLNLKARAAATYLGLNYERRDVGYGDLAPFLVSAGNQPAAMVAQI